MWQNSPSKSIFQSLNWALTLHCGRIYREHPAQGLAHQDSFLQYSVTWMRHTMRVPLLMQQVTLNQVSAGECPPIHKLPHRHTSPRQNIYAQKQWSILRRKNASLNAKYPTHVLPTKVIRVLLPFARLRFQAVFAIYMNKQTGAQQLHWQRPHQSSKNLCKHKGDNVSIYNSVMKIKVSGVRIW